MTLSSYTAYYGVFKKTVDFQLFCCRLGIEPFSVDEDLELKKLRIWGFRTNKAGEQNYLSTKIPLLQYKVKTFFSKFDSAQKWGVPDDKTRIKLIRPCWLVFILLVIIVIRTDDSIQNICRDKFSGPIICLLLRIKADDWSSKFVPANIFDGIIFPIITFFFKVSKYDLC